MSLHHGANEFLLYSGAFSNVYKAVDLRTGQKLAGEGVAAS